ncbi:hypothetical protein [Paenibacillus segetis]|nr:hypothetical protein [Paenibacillus segetis]
MGQIFIGLGVLLGLIFGFIDGFQFIAALSWFVPGIISGILFIAFGMMYELLEENNAFLRELLNRTNVETSNSPPAKSKSLGKSKSSLSSLSGYKMSSHE